MTSPDAAGGWESAGRFCFAAAEAGGIALAASRPTIPATARRERIERMRVSPSLSLFRSPLRRALNRPEITYLSNACDNLTHKLARHCLPEGSFAAICTGVTARTAARSRVRDPVPARALPSGRRAAIWKNSPSTRSQRGFPQRARPLRRGCTAHAACCANICWLSPHGEEPAKRQRSRRLEPWQQALLAAILRDARRAIAWHAPQDEAGAYILSTRP